MKVIKKYNQHRRDLTIDMECEGCGAEGTYNNAYDDDNFWVNVVPSFKCKKCGKSTKELGAAVEPQQTRYAAHESI